MPSAQTKICRAYVANADSRSISVLSLDQDSGAVTLLQTVEVSGSVMPLAISPDKRFLFASLRSVPFSVASFAVDAASGALTGVATSALPDSMASITVDPSGRWLLAASYGGHKVSVSPIGVGGVVGPAVQVLATGLNAHCVVLDATGQCAYVTNLGSDQILQFNFDVNTGQLSALTAAAGALTMRKGAGPRHLVLHPKGQHAYVLNELDAGVDLLAVDGHTGELRRIEHWSSMPAMPAKATATPWAADIHLSPDGRFLYTSERNTNTLAMWNVNASNGHLRLLGHVPTEQQPRGFAIDPSGRWLLAVGQASHSLTAYAIDAETGHLSATSRLTVGQNPNWVEIVVLSGPS